MKPEDVMRALDILDKMDFFQGQRAGRELWNEKPFEVQEQDIADFVNGIGVVQKTLLNALALLREKEEVERLKGALKAEERHNELTMETAQKALANARADTFSEIKTRFAMRYGTYTGKDMTPIAEVFRLLDQIAKERFEGK